MGYGKRGWAMAKGKETKGMSWRASFCHGDSGQGSLRADCSENVPSVPGFPPPFACRKGWATRPYEDTITENVPSVPGFPDADCKVSGFAEVEHFSNLNWTARNCILSWSGQVPRCIFTN
jgi:hypothetical protein